MIYLKTFFHISFFFIILLINSCVYEPNEKFFATTEKSTVIPPLNIDLNLTTDTINFYWSSPINLTVSSKNLKVLSVKYYLDNNEVSGSHTGNIYSVLFNFNQPGVHKFKFSILVSSGTNSLAGKLDAEWYQYDSREWTLIAKTTNPDTNLTYQLDNSGPLFSWKEYDGYDFNGYRLREISTGNSFDIQTTSFQNTNYAGGEGYYNIYTLDHENIEHLWGKCYINKSLPVLKLGAANNEILLVWKKSAFWDNIAGYQVFQWDITTPWQLIATLSANDTSLIIKTNSNEFAPFKSFYLYCLPKKYKTIENTSALSSFLNYVRVSLPGPYFENNYGRNSSGFYFAHLSEGSYHYVLYKYSTSTDKVSAIMDCPEFYSFSPAAKYLLISDTNNLKLYDLSSNTIVKSKYLESVTQYFHPESSFQTISDNGLCIFFANGVLYVLDLLNDELIASKSMNYGSLDISSNGQYFSVYTADSLLFYTINKNSISFLSGCKKSGGPYFFRNFDFCLAQPDHLYIFDAPILKIISCKDLSVVRSLTVGDYFMNIDFGSNKILTARNGSVFDIYDFNTGNLLETVNSSTLGTGSADYTLLNNNIIFFSGYKYLLKSSK